MITPTTYVTVNGDMWDYISFKLYGTEYFSDLLCYNNPLYAGVWSFDAGITLTVPFITRKLDIQTPPWLTIQDFQ